MYDAADSILSQKLAQVEGVGQVYVGGSSQPAVRIEANPNLLNKLNIGLDAVRTAVAAQNVNQAKGSLQGGDKAWMIRTNDQLKKAKDYRPIIVAYNNGAPVRLSDVADVEDSYSDTHVAGRFNGKPCVMIIIFRQPGANIIATVDRVIEQLPFLKASMPQGIKLDIALDRTTSVRASVADVQRTLIISLVLVVLVVFVFLREVRATLIPSVAVPLAIVGTFGVMYLLGYSLNNLSLMALTISTGFVVDDAIVVLENVMRHVEAGMAPYEAALLGAREIGFTVMSMSISLIAVFIPILLMSGLIGRLFHEFAMTISSAIAISMVVSLTTTPMLCAHFLKPHGAKHGVIYRVSEKGFHPPQLGVQAVAGMGAAASAAGLRDCHHHRLRQRLPLRHRTQGFLPAAGHRTHDGHHHGRPGHGVRRHAREGGRVHSHREERSRGRERDCLFRRQHGAEPGPHVRDLEASQPAQGQHRPGDQPHSPENFARAGSDLVLPGGAGPADRRPLRQRAISVHAIGRGPGRAVRVGAEADREAEGDSHTERRQQRPAGAGPAAERHHRSRYRGAVGNHAPANRQRAVRRLRTAPDLDHLPDPEPVPRGARSRPAISDDARRAGERLRDHQGWRPAANRGTATRERTSSGRRAVADRRQVAPGTRFRPERRCRCPHSRTSGRRPPHWQSPTRDNSRR